MHNNLQAILTRITVSFLLVLGATGALAQELQEVYPSLVSENDDTLYVSYTGMIPYLIKGMQVYIQGLLEQDEYDGKQTFQVVVSYGGDIQMLDGKMEKQEEKPADLPIDGVPF